MGLPLFSSSNLESPTMGGAVPSSTINLMVAEGNALTSQIEKLNQKAEAQAKAPAIATAYADAFTKISAGDFSGFGALEKANTLAIGNPLLENMAAGAHKSATALASSYIESQALQMKLRSDATLQDARLRNQIEIENKRGDREDTRYKNIADRDDERARNAADRQEEAEKARLDQQREDDWRAQMNVHAQNEAARERQSKLDGTPYTPSQPPPKPKFYSKAYTGAQDTTVSDPLVNENSKEPALPVKDAPSNALPAMGLPQGKAEDPFSDLLVKTDANPNPVTSGDIPVAPKTGPAAAVAVAQPKEQPQAKGKPQPTTEIKFGGLSLQVPATTGKPETEKTETVKTSSGTVSYKTQKDEPPQNKLAKAVSTIEGEDPSFAQWFSEQFEKGYKVTMRAETVDKKTVYQPYAVKPDRTEEAYGKRGPDQQPTKDKQPVNKTVYENFVAAQEVMLNELKGKMGIQLIKDPAAVEEGKKRTIDAILKGRITLDEAQKKLSVVKGGKFTDEEVKEIKKKIRQKEGMKQWAEKEGLTGLGNYSPLAGLR